jgi:hypothetical protein
MAHDVHLFLLQFHTGSFGARWQGRNGAAFLSMAWCRQAFHGLGVQDVTEFDSFLGF